jgi:hypothetical protein
LGRKEEQEKDGYRDYEIFVKAVRSRHGRITKGSVMVASRDNHKLLTTQEKKGTTESQGGKEGAGRGTSFEGKARGSQEGASAEERRAREAETEAI